MILLMKLKIFQQKKGDVIIGNNCWIGANVFIKESVVIGNNCVIGANSLVNKNIPDNCIVGGVPLRIIKKRGIKIVI